MNDNHGKRSGNRLAADVPGGAQLSSEQKLRERVKELNCLKRITETIDNSNQDLERIFQVAVDALSNAMYHSDIACARILFHEQSYQSERFRKTDWYLFADLMVTGKVEGAVEVYYLEKRPEMDEGPFLKEERNLVNLSAEKLGHAIEHLKIINPISIHKTEGDLNKNLESIIEKASNYAHALTATPSQDRKKLNELFEEARNWFENLPKEYLSERVIVRKYACYSHYYRWTEQYDEVFRCVIDINDFQSRDEDCIYFGWIYLKASRAANLLGLVSESIEYGYKAIDFIERSQNKSELCKCYNAVGVCFNPLEYHDVSFGFYKKAYRLSVETGNRLSMLSGLNNMGYNRILVGEFDKARKILLKAKGLLSSEITRSDMHTQINLNLAIVALHDNNLSEANEYVAIARRFNAIGKATNDTISILQIESDILVKENRLPEADETLKLALKLANEKQMDRYSAKIEKSLADVLILEKRYEEAVEHQRNCLLLQEKLTNERAQAQFRYIHYEREARDSRTALEEKLIELKQTEEKLQQENEKFELITTASPVTLIVMRMSDGVILYANEQFALMMGSDTSTPMHRHSQKFFASPSDLQNFLSTLIEKGTVQKWQVMLKKLDGTVFPALVSGRFGTFLGVECVYAGIEDITELKRAMNLVKESETKYKTLFEEAEDGIVLTDAETSVLTDVNLALCRMVDRDKQELIGKPHSILHSPETLIHGQSPTYQENQKNHPEYALEHLIITKDGRLVPVEIRSARVQIENREFLLGIFRDLTQRKQLEEREQKQQVLVQSIVNSTGDMIWSVESKSLELTSYNQKFNDFFSRILGINVRLGMTPDELLPTEELRKSWQALYARALREESFTIEYPMVTSGKTLLLMFTQLKRNDTVYGISVFANDITERIRAEAERSKLLEQLQKSIESIIQLVVHTVESRDPYTAGHQLRVAKLASAIAEEMGYPKEKVKQIHMAGSIHDLGKIAIPAEILSKPTRLNPVELMLIKTHPQVSKEILAGIDFSWPLAEVLYQHHERIDGSGYPQGLKGTEILPEAKILSVADVVEAMASHRPYRPALGLKEALDEITMHRGTLFDPAVVDPCLRLFEEKNFTWD